MKDFNQIGKLESINDSYTRSNSVPLVDIGDIGEKSLPDFEIEIEGVDIILFSENLKKHTYNLNNNDIYLVLKIWVNVEIDVSSISCKTLFLIGKKNEKLFYPLDYIRELMKDKVTNLQAIDYQITIVGKKNNIELIDGGVFSTIEYSEE